MRQTPARGRALGHVVINVTSLARSVPFYVEALGLRVVGRTDAADRNRIGEIVFLSFGINHHDLALREVPVQRMRKASHFIRTELVCRMSPFGPAIGSPI